MDDGQRLKRFTVSEAAEILHISKDAVRKRMQRGTLRYDKTLDGQVYVYLDAPKNQGGDRKAVATDPNEERSWDFAQLSALAGLAGAIATMIYVSGLFALWTPIARFYTHDFAASWHAVSIIPKTEVIGHGFTRIWLFTIAMVLVLPLPLLVVKSATRVRKTVRKTILVMMTIVTGALLGTVWIPLVLDKIGVISLRDLTANWPGENPPDIPGASIPDFTPLVFLETSFLGVILVLLMARLIGYMDLAFEPVHRDSSPSTEMSEILPPFFRALIYSSLPVRVASRINLLKAIAAVFLLGFLFSAWMAYRFTLEPPLPKVEVTTTANATVRGDLLAHVDGVWYVLNLKGEVLAVPDGGTKQARVFPEG